MRASHKHFAAPRRLKATNETARLRWLRATIAGAYVCGILVSPRLWFGVGRSFPRAPIIEVPNFILSHDYFLSILLLVALVLSIVSKRPRPCLVMVVALFAFLVFLDQARLQPWAYQYLIMLTLLACVRTGASNTESAQPVVAANQLVVALLYFWSGAQKLNWSFAHDVVPALLESAGLHLPPAYINTIALAIAACEILISVGLLIPRARHVAVLLALATHLSVLTILVSTGRNSVVWPWNIAMIVIVALLFWRCEKSPFGYVLRKWRTSQLEGFLPKAVVMVCGLLPAMSFAGWWDLYLSAPLYSGRTPIAVMHINESIRERLPARARQNIFATSRGELMLPFYEWSLSELNVPPYPEPRVYRQIAGRICVLTDDQQAVELIVRERPGITDGNYEVTRSSCANLSLP